MWVLSCVSHGEIKHPSFLHDIAGLLKEVVVGNECISEELIYELYLIFFIEMNGSALWDFRYI